MNTLVTMYGPESSIADLLLSTTSEPLALSYYHTLITPPDLYDTPHATLQAMLAAERISE